MINLQQKVIDHSAAKDYSTQEFAGDIDDNLRELSGASLLQDQTGSISIPIPSDSLLDKVLVVKKGGNPTVSVTYTKVGLDSIPLIPSDVVDVFTVSPVVGIYSEILATLSVDISGGTVDIKLFIVYNCTNLNP